jgi:anti-sigma B factor antagonist
MTTLLIGTEHTHTPEMPLRLGRCLAGSAVRALTRCHIIAVDGAMRVPNDSRLMPRVHAAIRSGARRVRLDLSRLSSIDAAGVGELVAAFNATKAVGGVLDIAHADRRVRRVLEVTGLYTLLTVCEPAAVS